MKILSLAGIFLSLSAFASGYDTPAEYEVPVPADLSPYSHFKMEGVKFENEGGRVRVSYKLPLELTGIENKLRFEGVDDGSGVLRLRSEQGVMECRVLAGVDTCRVKYTEISQDMPAVERLLDSQRLPLDVKQGIMAVAGRFGGDMQGIIRYQK
jgi:hypothetical protein